MGGARTVLFNWLLARQSGGTFVLRIEDTDRARHVEDSVAKITADLRWLGLDWDEGPETGGDFGPYFQSQRLDIYHKYIQQVLESGHAYYAFETPEQLEAMRESARAQKRNTTYIRPDPMPTIEEGEAARAAGKPVVVRFKMPDAPITIVDDILGEVTLAADQLEDFVIQKSDGFPTYHFACVVDDALMEISHVLRGQEHLMNTPKHVALQQALGLATPRYGHMPVIFNMNGSKMSKRDKEKAIKAGLQPPEIDVYDFRQAGYLPEALLNFLALLGWSPGDDRERFTLDELTDAFSVARIGKANAKFDRDKLLAFNTDWATRVTRARRLEALRDYATVNASPMARADDDLLGTVLQACSGFRTYADVWKKAGFLFMEDADITYDPKAVKKVLAKNEGAGWTMLDALLGKLDAIDDWSPEGIESAFEAIVEQAGTKLGNVAQPIRVAISGTTVSPSIHESLAILGKPKTLARIRRCLEYKTTNP